MRQLLARKDVRLPFAGQTLSMFGDWAMIIVLGIWTKVLTGSNGAAGLVFFVFALAGLAAPLGGLVVDRLPKRRLMIVTHVALAAVMCLLLLVHSRSDVWLLYAVTALYGLGGDIFAAARSAMLKAMLPDELLADANGAYQSIREGLRIVAPLAGAGPRPSSPPRRGSSPCGSRSLRRRQRSTTSSASYRPGSHTSRARACCAS